MIMCARYVLSIRKLLKILVMYENRDLVHYTFPKSSWDLSIHFLFYLPLSCQDKFIQRLLSCLEKNGDHPIILSQNAFFYPYHNLIIITLAELGDDEVCR